MALIEDSKQSNSIMQSQQTRTYICTKCSTNILGKNTVLFYIPTKSRTCPHCGAPVVKSGSVEARRHIKMLEDTYEKAQENI